MENCISTLALVRATSSGDSVSCSVNVICTYKFWSLPASAGDTGDVGSIPGLGRCPEGENGNAIQSSYLKESMDRAAWQVIQSILVRRVKRN